jgi:translation elongation factor EF-1beta
VNEVKEHNTCIVLKDEQVGFGMSDGQIDIIVKNVDEKFDDVEGKIGEQNYLEYGEMNVK